MTSTSDRSSTSPDVSIEAIYRAEWGRLLSLLVSRTRRLDLAEDALGEAFARAADTWRSEAIPSNPTGWLYTTAHRQILGRLRAEAIAGRKAPLLAVSERWAPSARPDDEWGDDRLALILLCCHPALHGPSRSGLALRLVLGTPTEEIARLFLVSKATMAARLTRAKKKIVVAGIPIDRPLEEELRIRLDEVCRTIYLAFTAGYTPGTGPELLRADLAGEAVRLAALLETLEPEASQVRALHALLVLQHCRRDARVIDGQLVTLVDQDRSRWHTDEAQPALEAVAAIAPGTGYGEELRLQALIAAHHVEAATAADTDWRAIAGHYAALEATTGSAVVRLNRAVAVAEVDGPTAGLAVLAELDDALGNGHRLHAVRADFHRRAGATAAARTSYELAIERCGNDVETAHLRTQLLELD